MVEDFAQLPCIMYNLLQLLYIKAGSHSIISFVCKMVQNGFTLHIVYIARSKMCHSIFPTQESTKSGNENVN